MNRSYIFLSVIVVFTLAISACGRKGPPLPPENFLPSLSAVSVVPSDGGVVISGTMDKGVKSVVIEKIVRKSGEPEETRRKLTETEKESFKYVDREISAGNVYRYIMIPIINNGDLGNEFLSQPVEYLSAVYPVESLSAKVEPLRGSVSITWSGSCEDFAVYRYPSALSAPLRPFAVTTDESFVDEYPQHDVETTYEVRCRVKGFESADNPKAKIKI